MIVGSSVAVSVKRVVTCFILTSSQQQQRPAPSSTPSSSSSSSTNNNNNNNNNNNAAHKADNWTRDNLLVAVFQRKDTMPTFPSHWAGISGSMEGGEEPWQTALRELQEETNLVPSTFITGVEEEKESNNSGDNGNNSDNNSDNHPRCDFDKMGGGLYLDVPFQPQQRNIRVYPFVVRLHGPADAAADHLQLRGTEHESFQFVSVAALESLEPTVPGLATAFHHATHGRFLARTALPAPIWKWAENRVNGSATLAQQVIELAIQHSARTTTNDATDLSTMAMLRPSMVPIVNVLKAMKEKIEQLAKEEKEEEEEAKKNKDNQEEENDVMLAASSSRSVQDELHPPPTFRQIAGLAILDSLEQEMESSVQLGVEALLQVYQEHHYKTSTHDSDNASAPPCYTIATISRSSTIFKILLRFLAKMIAKNQYQHEHEHETENTNDTPQQPKQSHDEYQIRILCAKSTPGDEGELMAQDLINATKAYVAQVTVECVEDAVLHQLLLRDNNNNNNSKNTTVHVILAGSDCIMDDQVVNKVGTKALAEMRSSKTKFLCFADRWKLWNDVFPPPLKDIFECVPRNLLDQVIVSSSNK